MIGSLVRMDSGSGFDFDQIGEWSITQLMLAISGGRRTERRVGSLGEIFAKRRRK